MSDNFEYPLPSHDMTSDDYYLPNLPVKRIRLFIGLIVFTLAEIFSGASPIGLVHPFILIVTYPLYFTHFFVLATIARKTKHTTMRDLYFFGCIYGLYETFITKVLWFGYMSEDGFAFGGILGFGIHETFGVAFLWHPIMSFMLPMYISLLLLTKGEDMLVPFKFFRETDNMFHRKRFKQILVVFLAFMLWGTRNLPIYILGIGSTVLLLWLGYRSYIRPYTFTPEDLEEIFILKRKGLFISGIILAILYVGGYYYLVPDRMPTQSQLLITISLYVVFILLILTTRYNPVDKFHPDLMVPGSRIWKVFRTMILIGIVTTAIYPFNIVFFLIPTILLIPFGFLMMIYFLTWGFHNKGSTTDQLYPSSE